MAFHVDYWNYLGWRDPWSSKPFSDRQRAYAHSWKSDSVYTPGFVLNGKEWRGLSKSIPVATSKPGVLKMTSDDLKTWNVTFSPAVPVGDSYEVHVAMLTSDLVSDVKVGENRGRRLAHDFVVLESRDITLKPESSAFSGSASFELKSPTGRNALVVWITKSGQLEPLQATGGYVN